MDRHTLWKLWMCKLPTLFQQLARLGLYQYRSVALCSLGAPAYHSAESAQRLAIEQ